MVHHQRKYQSSLQIEVYWKLETISITTVPPAAATTKEHQKTSAGNVATNSISINDENCSSDSTKRKDTGIEVIAHSLMVPIIADAAAATYETHKSFQNPYQK
jgi:hypothetical protein